jgi:hydroxyacylglutathione hydrolase
LEAVKLIAPGDLHARLKDGEPLAVLDVRQQNEWETGHIPGALHIENGRLPWDDLPLPTDRPIVVHCAHGARSMAAISVLRRRSYPAQNLMQVEGGFTAWEKAGGEVAYN